MMWWHWLLLGLVLVATEMAAAGGFYFIFFGVAALLIALLQLVGIVDATWLQLLLFSVLSVASLLLFRNPLMRRLHLTGGATDIDSLSGARGTVLEAMAPGAPGRVEVRGTTWSARNVGSTALQNGARCDVVRSERLTLLVKAEEAHS
jgi:membrane protein implicated in regulation of membrane protease activity